MQTSAPSHTKSRLIRCRLPDRSTASFNRLRTVLPLIALVSFTTPARAQAPELVAAANSPLAGAVLPAVAGSWSIATGAPSTDLALLLPQAVDVPAPVLPEPGAQAAYGPVDRQPTGTDGPRDRLSFGDRLESVKWETVGLAAYLTAINLPGLLDRPSGFDFESEGLFGKNTANLGVDKVAHAYNAYVLSDVLYWRMRRKTGASSDSALASSAIAVGLDLYAELFDAFEERSGFSISDVGFNVAGAAFSYARNTVPGLKEKLDLRLMIIPNRDIYSISNKKEHFRQERFLFALKLAGFEGLRQGPLRLLELHLGYYARGFTDRERARGAPRERKPFVGIGVNLEQLLFPTSRSAPARVARSALDYIQIPYTAVHID